MTPHQPSRRDAEEYGDQILSKAVKAGRRTYFFDVRATRGDDYFLTITESRKMQNPDGIFRAQARTRGRMTADGGIPRQKTGARLWNFP